MPTNPLAPTTTKLAGVVTWIVLGAVLLGLLTLAAVLRPLLARLPRLRRAAVTLQGHRVQAESLQRSALQLRDRAEALQRQVEVVQARLPVRRSPSGR